MSSFLERITNRARKGPEIVPTPEWSELDGQVYVRRLDAETRIEFYSAAFDQKANKGANFYAFVVCFCAVTADGTRMFADGDWQTLVKDPGSGSAIDRIYEAADEINFLSDSSREKLKKKSEATSVCGDSSASQEPSGSA